MTGRVAIVAGGTGALGQSVVSRFLAAGATVCIPYAVPAELEALRARLAAAGARVHALPADVADEAAFGAFAKSVLDAHGRIDILVNGVGGFAGGDLVSTPIAEWQRMLALNLMPAVIGSRAVLPAMTAAGYGRIVNVASRAVVPPMGGFIAYTVAKAGVITLTQALAREVAHGITVNAVLPSTMDTPANRAAMPESDRRGWVPVEAVADAIAMLCREESAHITGTLLAV